MGNASTKPTGTHQGAGEHMFAKELKKIDEIVNAMLTDKNVFRDNEYNFLSQEVCSKNYLLLESDLKKHLKVNLKQLGETLYLIPKERETAYKINKSDVCKRITNHYMKILYVICLIKYVYNVERHGEYSISGIIMRNITLVGDLLEINYCNVQQKDYSRKDVDPRKLDFSQLQGLRFLAQYFLTKEESSHFIGVLKSLLARKPKGLVRRAICEKVTQKGPISPDYVRRLEKAYKDRFNESLTCAYAKPDETPSKVDATGARVPDEEKATTFRDTDFFMVVERENPVFSSEYCAEPHKLVIQKRTKEERQVHYLYQTMKRNYEINLMEIERLLDQIVMKQGDKFVLRDLDKKALDDIVLKVKDVVKTYYIQSIMDYHVVLDAAKSIPVVKMNMSKS